MKPSESEPAAPDIIILTPRGFCSGVERAIRILDRELKSTDSEVWAFNQIVHNRYVVQDFSDRGVKFFDWARFTEEYPNHPDLSGHKMVLSAHGVSPQVRQALADRRLTIVDATCPLVNNVHRRAVTYADRGYWVILIGKSGHEETEGILGESERVVLVENVEQVKMLPSQLALKSGQLASKSGQAPATNPLANVPMIWISQTTLSMDDTEQIVQALVEQFSQIERPATDCICYATQERQNAVKQAAEAGVDFLLVIGSANSSNSQRLVEVARAAGIRQVELVEDEGAISPDWDWARARKIGITAGASVPEFLVQRVWARVRELVSEI